MATVLEEIVLDVTLWDGAGDKYVKATIKGDGIEVIYSPVVLPHIGLGQYLKTDSSIVFPANIKHLSIVYEVFSDNAYSIKSNQHSNATEHYLLTEGDSLELIDTINKAMNELRKVNIEVDMMEEESVQAVFDYRDTPDTIEILVEEEIGIVISVEQEDEISGTIVENDIIENIGD